MNKLANMFKHYTAILLQASEEIEKLQAQIITCELQLAEATDTSKYYQGLLDKCGSILGDKVFITDDNMRSATILYKRIPEILEGDYK